MKTFLIYMCMAVLLCMGSLPYAEAQTVTRGTFNPPNPPEPQERFLYALTVEAANQNVAYTSGAGQYTAGTSVWVSTSLRRSNYVFKHWTLNGEVYSTSQSFSFTMPDADTQLVAHYDFVPSSPAEPNVRYVNRLYLENEMYAAGSFNISSGTKIEAGQYITLQVYVNQGYEFLGWYKDDVLISMSTSFNFEMPNNDVTFVARFRYNPFSPSEPEHDDSQENVENYPLGDVNQDGVVDIFDVVALINRSLDSNATELGAYDVNKDGEVDVFDVVEVINISLN